MDYMELMRLLGCTTKQAAWEEREEALVEAAGVDEDVRDTFTFISYCVLRFFHKNLDSMPSDIDKFAKYMVYCFSSFPGKHPNDEARQMALNAMKELFKSFWLNP